MSSAERQIGAIAGTTFAGVGEPFPWALRRLERGRWWPHSTVGQHVQNRLISATDPAGPPARRVDTELAEPLFWRVCAARAPNVAVVTQRAASVAVRLDGPGRVSRTLLLSAPVRYAAAVVGHLGRAGASARRVVASVAVGALGLLLPVVAPANAVTSHPLGGIVQISSGRDYSCVAISDGTVRCWGSNGYGVLGADHGQICQNAYPCSTTPLLVQSTAGILDNVVEISAGADHTCARRQDGTVWCWGDDHYGQDGDGVDNPYPAQFAVEVLDANKTPLTHVVQISAGYQATCALLDDATARAAGATRTGASSGIRPPATPRSPTPCSTRQVPSRSPVSPRFAPATSTHPRA